MARNKTPENAAAQPATITPPRAKALEEKTSLYTRFLGWASLNMPGFWRLRLEILLIGYVVLFLAAIGTPVIFAGMSGPNDRSTECTQYRLSANYAKAASEGRTLPNVASLPFEQYESFRLDKSIPCAGALRTYSSSFAIPPAAVPGAASGTAAGGIANVQFILRNSTSGSSRGCPGRGGRGAGGLCADGPRVGAASHGPSGGG